MLRLISIRFLSNWRNLLPLCAVIVFFLASWLAPIISPAFDPKQPAFNKTGFSISAPEPPSDENPLGTFQGYDVFHTVVWGTRTALEFGLTVALSTAAIGVAIGAMSNFLGGIFGRLGMRITDAFMAFPSLAAVMLLTQLFTPQSPFLPPNQFQVLMASWHVQPVTLALVLFSWMPYSRITFASIEQQKEQEYVAAARVMGLGNFKIFFRHILPNIISPLIVLVTKDIGGMVVLESAFVFIGVSNFTEWGQMIAASKNWIIGPTGFNYWWTFFPATLALILFAVSWQLLGQRINAAINPRAYSYLD